ncbi:MAG TPA: hypothetical protein VFC24_07840 [Casimicrobiaceae bacterium]|nr:hypothetical protein [Casimicrobiaceae bacterium]
MAENARAHMPDRLSLPGIGVGLLVVVTSIVIALIAAFVLMRLGHEEGPRPHVAAGLRPPPAIAGNVILQPQPAQDIAAFRAEKRAKIETYGWVDRERGIARIPIERAMSLLAASAEAQGAKR